ALGNGGGVGFTTSTLVDYQSSRSVATLLSHLRSTAFIRYSLHADAAVGCGGCPRVCRRELFLRGGRVSPLLPRQMAGAPTGGALAANRWRGRAFAGRAAGFAGDDRVGQYVCQLD